MTTAGYGAVQLRIPSFTVPEIFGKAWQTTVRRAPRSLASFSCNCTVPLLAQSGHLAVGIGVGADGAGNGPRYQCDLRDLADRFNLNSLNLPWSPSLVAQAADLVGLAHARMILYTAWWIDAEEAQRIGLINKMVDDEDLNDEVLEIARTIADNAPLSVAASKLTIGEMLKDESQRDMAAIARMMQTCFDSADYKEGRTAFMEKRAPKWVGR
jgi:hypothetical protein